MIERERGIWLGLFMHGMGMVYRCGCFTMEGLDYILGMMNIDRIETTKRRASRPSGHLSGVQ